MGYYKFRVVFSGPCAYVPNILKGTPKSVTSLSVILPELRKGSLGDAVGIQADRHRAALVYSPDDFDVDEDPDAVLFVKSEETGLYKHSSLYFLRAERVTFKFPGANNLIIEDEEIASDIIKDRERIKELIAYKDKLLRSIDWLPAMKRLRPDLQWFGAE